MWVTRDDAVRQMVRNEDASSDVSKGRRLEARRRARSNNWVALFKNLNCKSVYLSSSSSSSLSSLSQLPDLFQQKGRKCKQARREEGKGKDKDCKVPLDGSAASYDLAGHDTLKRTPCPRQFSAAVGSLSLCFSLLILNVSFSCGKTTPCLLADWQQQSAVSLAAERGDVQSLRLH